MCLQAPNGNKAIELATQYHPDVIILDVVLAECTGIQVVERLQANAATKHIPVLVHTGTVLDEDQRQQLAGQVQSVCSKSDPEQLLASLEQIEDLDSEALPAL